MIIIINYIPLYIYIFSFTPRPYLSCRGWPGLVNIVRPLHGQSAVLCDKGLAIAEKIHGIHGVYMDFTTDTGNLGFSKL